MQDVFDFRNALIEEYGRFSRSFTRIASQDISKKVELSYSEGRYWPEPLSKTSALPGFLLHDSPREADLGL